MRSAGRRPTNFETRTLSALVMVAVVLALAWQGGLAFRFLAAAIGLGVFYEWETITGVRQTGRSLLAGWLAVLLMLAVLLSGAGPAALLALVAVCGVIVAIVTFGDSGPWPAMGVVYAAFPAVALSMIRGSASAGLIAILFLFAVVWATDIFAYFAGRTFGGPRLAPRISPKKTWAGAIGGTLAAVLAGSLLAIAVGKFDARIPLVALALSVAAQIGDLAESWLKRRFGVKDSSHIIPGHGGVMDRVDGLVAAASLLYVLMAVSA